MFVSRNFSRTRSLSESVSCVGKNVCCMHLAAVVPKPLPVNLKKPALGFFREEDYMDLMKKRFKGHDLETQAELLQDDSSKLAKHNA